MWLASLRRFVFGNSHSRKERRRLAARSRKQIRPRLESLEERLTPSGGQTAGSYSALVNAIAVDTAANTNYVIDITNNFTFNSGGQITISTLGAGSTLTLEGQNGINYTLTGNGNRLFDIARGQTVTLEDLTLTGGNVTATNGPALGGAVYNSGNLSMKSVVVGGNQAVGGNGQSAAGGGIYSSGGSLTLSHDVLGRAIEKTKTFSYNYKTLKTTSGHATLTPGASNKAAGGTGGSGLGGGLYVAGGTVNVSNCVIAGNQATGSLVAQGGGMYAKGVTQLNLTNDVIGYEKVTSSSGAATKSGPTYLAHSTKTIGSANKALGGTAMGGGLFVSGGTVNVSQGVIGDNQAIAGTGQNAAGGGMFSTGASLTVSHVVVGFAHQRSLSGTYKLPNFTLAASNHSTKTIGASNKAVSGSGGSAQGGGLYVAGGGTVNVSNCTIADNQISGSLLAQGGGLYVSGVSQLNLKSDVIGHATFHKGSYLPVGATTSSKATAETFTGKSLGNANKAFGGNAMGGGLYVSGGTVNVSQGGIGSNQAVGGTASAALYNNGGNAQGGGIYVNNANLTLTGAVMAGDVAEAGNGGKGATGIWVGGTGGNAQGGVIFATNSTVIASGTTIGGSARPGNGGTGATGTSNHLTGGMGGEAGAGQGGGVYIKGGSLTLKNATEVGGIIYHAYYGPGNYYNQIMGAQGGKGGTGYNVTSGVGGVGGQGNTDAGGGVFASDAPVVMETGANIQFGQIHAGVGGQGGRGKTGGQGGVGGTALGGGMFVQGGSVSISGANSPLGTETGIYFNSINQNNQNGGFPIPLNGGTGGGGGSGTLAGNGGQGGDAYGGGLYAFSTSVTLNNGAVIDDNLAYSGQGGSGATGITGTPNSPGGNGGIGGAAGTAAGGGVYLGGTGVSLEINTGLTNPALVDMSFNGAIGGFGGFGGSGGRGGQKLNAGNKNPTTGQSGGNGGNAGNAGTAEGGGLYVDASSSTPINLNNAQFLFNNADGGEGGFAGNGGTGSFGSWAGGNGGSGGLGGSAVGAGVYIHQGALTLTNTTIEGNISQGGKGGPGAAGGEAFGFTVNEGAGHGGIAGNGGFGNVGGAAQGGGLYANATTVSLNTSIIDGNGSYGGKGGQGGFGGVTYIHRTNGSGFDRRSSSGSSAGNGAAGQGGGVFATGNSTLTALNSDLSGNAVDGGAGGTGGNGGYYASYLYNTGGNGGIGGNAGNGAVGQGGGAYVNGGTFTLVNTTVADNTLWGGNGGSGGAGGNGSDGNEYGGSGGAGGNGGNAAPASGGGVFATVSALKLVNDTVADNTINVENGEIGGAGGKGGNGGNAGKTQANPPTTKASRQGVGGNAGNGGNGSTGQGGGLYLGGGSLSLLNDTFAYNTVATFGTPGAAGTPGKGIFNNTFSPPVRLTADGQPGTAGLTIGTDQDGGLYVASSVTSDSVENTIIALNTAATVNDASATFSSSDDDFIGDGTGFSATTSNGDSVGQYTNAQLTSYFGPLGSNGGPTQTIVPYATSPTIGAGDPNAATAIAQAEGVSTTNPTTDTTDQRGLARFNNGAIDIGSTELQVDFTGSPSVTTVQAGQSGQTITYTMNLTNGEGEPLNVNLTDIIPGGTTYNSNSAGGTVSSTYSAGWTFTQPSLTNSNTLTATATLDPGETATLTFTVTVLPTASGTITDTANLGWTGTVTNTTGSSSVAMNTTVSGGVSTTTTNLTTSGTPSVYGQSVTFQATVSGSGTPTGEVVFEDGNTILAKETLSSGVATFTTSALSVANHNITAIYCGDTNDSGSTSNTVSQVVDPDSTTTTLASMPVSSVYGQSVNLTATVSVNSPGAGTPTGKVTFYDGSTKLGCGTLSNGIATLTTSTLPVGDDSLTAVYGGDTNDTGSTSVAISQAVGKDSTTTTLAASQPSVYGQAVTFTATVSVNSPGAGTPTGTVTFYDGNTELGTGTLSNGVATFTTSTTAPLPVGSDSITAVYGGDANDQASPPSSALSQTVNQDSTTTTLTSSASSPVYGQAVTFAATVSANSPGSGTPTGTVTFYDGTTELGTGTLNSSGVATFTTSTTAPLPVGTDSITAVYSGDTNYLTSTTSSALSQVVNQDQTTTTVTSSANPSVLAQNVTLTATVSVVSPGAGTPTGTVTFYDGTTELGTGTLNSSGVATLSLSSLPVGNNNITAVYSGDSDDLGSTSNALTQEVQYHFGGFLPPLSNGLVYEINRTIPIKFTLSDYNGNAITSLSAVTSIQIQELDSSGNPIGSPFTPVSTNNQGLVYTGGHYQYNWQTKGLSAGSYEIEVNLADGTTQTKTITLTANGSAAGLTAGSSGGAATAGALLGGEVDLYVDNSDGDLTSDELARIQDAINAENAVIAPYGVTIVTVTDPTLSNATLSMNTTSSVGGYAQGVLGCTSNADLVTMIQGWDWYAGSDPTQIGSGQYDLETAVMHELGHVLGLGHSSSSTSVMYATLAPGTTNRNLTTADLNVSGDGGSDGLHAVAAAPVGGTSSGSSTTPPSLPSANPTANTAGSQGSGSPLSLVDRVFADIDLFLSDSWIAYQSEISSMSALRQQAEALALQSFDMLLGFQAGAMGLSQDTLIRTLRSPGNSSSSAV